MLYLFPIIATPSIYVMASLQIFIKLFSIFLLAINVKAQATSKKQYYSEMIPLGSSLSPNADNISWPSPSGHFALGFYQQGKGFAVGIWMVNQPENIIVWTANRDDPPVSSNATLELTRTGWLLLTEQGKEKNISYTDEISSPASSAAMLDAGNFVLYNGSSYVIWQSFDYPTDTILEGQNLNCGNQLVSSKSGSDHSSGRFLLIMQHDGNLVSYPANISTLLIDAYWSTGTFGRVDQLDLSLNHRGSLFLSNNYSLHNGSNTGKNKTIMYRATLDYDGIFRLYSHRILKYSTSLVVLNINWSSLQNRCEVKGYCGFNSYCEEVTRGKYECHCYPGFVFISPGNKFLGCYQNFSEESCTDHNGGDDDGRPKKRMSYDITSLKNMWWYDPPYTLMSLEEEACKKSCMDDCNCWAALHTNISCRKFNFPIRYGRRSNDIQATALIKVALHNVSTLPVLPNYPVAEYSVDNKTISVLGFSLGSVACLCFVFAISSFIVYKHRYHRYKKLLENANLGLAEDFTLQSFSYNELERATNGFNGEIGRGTYGAVYKGILSEGNKNIAVKRLEKVAEEGVREFRAEMTTIGRTHHRNLVQLLGFCIEGTKKLLVYEFMSKGSLADRLFKAATIPTWRERVRFVLDVARGIFYLHEECGVHIIHCNLKPQNILLDDTWTAKISDFGLARLLMPNQAKASMEVEGTSLGYLAPEWQKNALISVKADIYSFGIVLLEIICCRRNLEINVSTADEITLSKWVYTCFKDGKLDKLIVEDEEVDAPTLERMIKVGLWCIQDDPTLRPSMKEVILMLEGTMVIPVPPSPELVILP